MTEHECVFAEEQEPSGRLVLTPCITCGLTAMDALEQLRGDVLQHTPLTEAERQALIRAGDPWNSYRAEELFAAVEAILAARTSTATADTACPAHSGDPIAKAVATNRRLLGQPPQDCTCATADTTDAEVGGVRESDGRDADRSAGPPPDLGPATADADRSDLIGAICPDVTHTLAEGHDVCERLADIAGAKIAALATADTGHKAGCQEFPTGWLCVSDCTTVWHDRAADTGLRERVEALADELATERDSLRTHYRNHNAGRSPDRPRKRPDLDTWANAYEVAERKVRALLDATHASTEDRADNEGTR